MPTFTTDWDGLKRLAKEYLDALPTANLEEAKKGFDCFTLHWLGLVEKNANERLQAEYLVLIVGKKLMERECALLLEEKKNDNETQ